MKTRFYRFFAWADRPMAVAVCAVTVAALHAPAAFAAGGQACSVAAMVKENGWNITNNLAGIGDGVAIADITFSNTTTATGTQAGYFMSFTVLMPAASGAYQTIPLTTFPGLGLRLRFAGYVDGGNAQLNPSNVPAVGTTATTNMLYWGRSPFQNGSNPKTFKLLWKLELVVTDVRVYAGGTGNFAKEPGLAGMGFAVLPTITDNTSSPTNQACSSITSSIGDALVSGVIQLPELPKPPTPTCQFPIGSLNQTVTLNRGTTGSVPANGASRAEGAVGETQFFINAVNCGANTDYALYFTDANQTGGNKPYLISTGALAGKVNLRMYSGSSTNPIQFGPPPLGGSMPSYAAGLTNSGTAAGSTFNHDFTVQYVRAPGYAGALSADSLAAKAMVTVVYP